MIVPSTCNRDPCVIYMPLFKECHHLQNIRFRRLALRALRAGRRTHHFSDK